MRLMRATATAVAVVFTAGACAQQPGLPDRGVSGLVGTGAGAECVIPDPVPIGLVLSMSGGASFAGAYQEKGLELAFRQLNAKPGVTYQIILEDDRTTPGRGVEVYEKLIDRDRVSAIIGPTLSSVAFPAFSDAQAAGVPALGISTTAEGIPEIGDYIFRDSLPELDALNASIPAAKDNLGFTTAAILHDSEDEFTESAYTTMKEALEAEGVEIVADEEFGTADESFGEQLARVKAAQPQAVVLSALPKATVPLVKQARGLGITAPIVGGNAFNSPFMIEKLGAAAEGLIVGGAWSAQLDTPGNRRFIADFEREFGIAPDQFAAQAYVAAHLIDTAVRADCDGNREAIKDNLGQILELDTILGPLSIDQDGEVYQDPVVHIVRDGKFVLLRDD